MKKKAPAVTSDNSLRHCAEDQIRERQGIRDGEGAETRRAADVGRLLHELEVHQVELEMQNAELRRTRDALEAGLENYTDLYDFAPVGYFTITAEGLVRMVNLTGAGLAETARSLLIGRPFRQLLPEPQRKDFDRFLAGVMASTTVQEGEYELQRMGQPKRIVNVVARPLPGGEECRAAVMDVTERKQTETALRVSEEFNRSVVESSPDCIKVLDPAGNLLSFLQGTEAFLGINDVNPFLNKSWTGFWEGTDRLAARQAVADAAAGREGSFVGFLPTPREEPKWWDVKISPIYDADGKPSRLLAVSRDVSDRKRGEMDLSFLASLSLDLVQCNNVDEMMQVTGAEIGKYFDLSACAFIEIDEAAGTALIAHDWRGMDAPSIAGTYPLAELFGEEFIATARKGGVLVVADTAREPRTIPQQFKAMGLASFVNVPLLREGQWHFALGFYRKSASLWHEHEIGLMTDLAFRIGTRLERLQAMAALRESEERYRTLFTSIDEGFCLIELQFDSRGKAVDWTFLEVNPSFEKQTGLSDVIGRRVRELIPELEETWFEIYGRVALTGGPVRFIHEAKEVGARCFDLYAFRVGGPESRKVAVIFTNITDRQNTEKQLSEKARLLDLSHDAIIVRDMSGKITYWNHGAEELYGWSRAEAMGQISHLLLRTEFPTPRQQMVQELHQTGRWTGELLHRKRNGRKVTVLVRKTMDYDNEKNPSVVMENITDITDRKKAEAVQRRLEVITATNRKLEQEIIRRKAVESSLKQSEHEQRVLLAQARHLQQQLRGMSHQILNAQEEERKRISRELHDVIAQTLVGINVHVAALGKGGTGNPAEFRQNISRTQQLVEHSVEVVHQFARELRPTMLDDLGLIPALQGCMKTFMEDTGVRVTFQACASVEECPDNVRTVLYRVAQEALTNVARHAMATRVEVTIQPLEGVIFMEIRDNGKGFTVNPASSMAKSPRLGLLGMRERVEMVGGTFQVASAPGQSTIVRAEFTAPRRPAKPRTVKQRPAANAALRNTPSIP